MAAQNHRLSRVADVIQRELAQLIQMEIKDPRLDMVTICDVEVSRDFAHAKIYVTIFGDEAQAKKNVDILNKASGFLRRALGKRLTLRVSPQLKFIYDPSVATGNRISELIDQAISEEGKKD